MGRGQAAQAQAQHQANINHTESLELSIFHVSYLRGLFPDDSFKGVDMKNLDDMHIKMLVPKCEESRRLVDWVEKGVYDAIKRCYLKNLFFGISTDPDGTYLLEEYIFSFTYGEDGVSMDVAAKAHGKECGNTADDAKKKSGKGGAKPKADIATVRYQICRLMRMLVQICQTLDKVPSERYLFMKLTYNDSAPEEYEPPYFIPVNEDGVGHFKRQPFSMAVGNVTTEHHSVALKVKSVLDACDDMDDQDGGEEPKVSARSTSAASDGGASASGAMQDAQSGGGGQPGDDNVSPGGEEEQRAEEAVAAHPKDKPTGANELRRRAKADLAAMLSEPQRDAQHMMAVDEDKDGNGAAGDEEDEDATEAPLPEAFYAVKAFATSRAKVDMRELACHFSHLAEEELGSYIAIMVREGELKPVAGHAGVYKPKANKKVAATTILTQAEVESAPRAAAGGPLQPANEVSPNGDADMIAHHMTSLTMGEDTRRVQDQALKSMAARMESTRAGDALTISMAAGHSKRGAAAAADQQMRDGAGGEACAEDAPVNYFQDSQHSNKERRSTRRKASYVANPIQQGQPAAKRSRAAAPAAPPPPAANTVAVTAGSTPAPRGGKTGRLAAMRRN